MGRRAFQTGNYSKHHHMATGVWPYGATAYRAAACAGPVEDPEDTGSYLRDTEYGLAFHGFVEATGERLADTGSGDECVKGAALWRADGD